MPAKKMFTATTMLYTDGTTSRYAVMVGPMKRKAFNAHAADIVAVYELTAKASENLYRELTAKHATASAPAVYWQA